LLRYRDFCDFQDGGSRPLQKFEMLAVCPPYRDNMRLIMRQFIKIDQAVPEIWLFNGFQNGGCTSPWSLEIQFFNGQVARFCEDLTISC